MFAHHGHRGCHSISAVLRVSISSFADGPAVEMLDPGLSSGRGFRKLILGSQIKVRLKISLNLLQFLHAEVVGEVLGEAVEKRQNAAKQSKESSANQQAVGITFKRKE